MLLSALKLDLGAMRTGTVDTVVTAIATSSHGNEDPQGRLRLGRLVAAMITIVGATIQTVRVVPEQHLHGPPVVVGGAAVATAMDMANKLRDMVGLLHLPAEQLRGNSILVHHQALHRRTADTGFTLAPATRIQTRPFHLHKAWELLQASEVAHQELLGPVLELHLGLELSSRVMEVKVQGALHHHRLRVVPHLHPLVALPLNLR